MPKAQILQASFNSGELSPLAYGETTLPGYKKGLETCLNYIPTLQGPLQRRPGTKYLNAVKDSTKPPVLIPFQFSLTQAYMLEFGDQYIRFYANAGQIVTSSTVYVINSGFYQDPATPSFGNFYATRATNVLGAGETTNPFTIPTVPAGTILELATPYAWTDVAKIKYAQTQDTLYLFHPNYPVYKLQRFGQQYWTLKQVVFQDGPYLAPNSYMTFGDSTAVTLYTGTNYALAPQVYSGPLISISGMVTDPGLSGQIRVTTSTAHGFSNGQKVYITGVVGTTEANNNDTAASNPGNPYYWVIQVTSTTTFLLVGSTFVHTYSSGGTVQPALFAADIDSLVAGTGQPNRGRAFAFNKGTVRYFGLINTVVNAARVSTYIGPQGIPRYVIPDSTTADTWQFGVYSTKLGYPSCATFHQNRLVVAGALNSPQEIDGSNTGDYENFSPSVFSATNTVKDSNAYSFILNSKDINAIKWLASSSQGLLAGSLSAEWSLTASSPSESITPSNVNANQSSFYGSADADAVQIGNATLYIQKSARKLRELNYFFQAGTFRSTDVTVLSEHITIPSITKLAVQKETQPLVWAVRGDGALVSMIYDRTDVSIQAGWTRHILGGKSDSAGNPPIVTSIGFIPSVDTTFDQMWLIVKRYINGTFVYAIELMSRIFDDSMAQADACQFDCAGTYDVSKGITGVTTAATAVVTATGHGLVVGDKCRITNVVGLTQTAVDLNGNTIVTSLVNGKTFVVGPGSTTSAVNLYDLNGNPVSSVGYAAYISGGTIAKLVTSIAGLTWLIGETVNVLADGANHPPVVVSGTGGITLQFPAAKVQIGYGYNSDGKLLRTEAGAADGTSIGCTRRTARAAFMLHNVGDLSVGTEFNNLFPINFEYADSQLADSAAPLYNGIHRSTLESKIDFNSQVCFRQSSGLPGMVQAVTVFMEEQDV